MNPFAAFDQTEITPAGVRRIRQGHLWVYAGDVAREPADSGSPIVEVVDSAQNPLGYALYSRQSQIRLRFLTREHARPTADLIRNRLRASVARRRHLDQANTACRLVFGEADLLPSIVVDRYGEYLALQTLSSGADALKSELVEMLADLLRPKGIVERNDVKARRLEGLEEVQGILMGSVPPEVEIVEGGVRFLVELSAGQKTGFFLDQRDNRVASRRYAFGRALDCFTNTGAFALHFAACCPSVLAIDVSPAPLLQARRNADLNGAANVEFREGNVFDLLRDLERAGEKFDTICLDPPAFAKSRSALAGALGGYKEINLRAMRILSPEGILVTSSCSYHLTEPAFWALLCQAARDAHRYIQVVERRGQAGDHPVLATMPETHYLKCFVLRVL
ncbi:MAG TPA: class I SAM-dependent rRNA methyltransferase [Acidobacteriota bacterium]|nr:class I SAM-dependent rRNA methyltransferase [Acidobacteriota bacterium]